MPPVTEVAQASAGWDLGKEIDNALAALVRLLQGVASLGIWLVIVVVPVAVPVVLAFWIAYRLLLRWRRTHPCRAASGPRRVRGRHPCDHVARSPAPDLFGGRRR